MILQQLAGLTFQFQRAAFVSLTQKCPIRCRHCFVESGPERKEHADFTAFKQWIDQIVATENLEVVFFSGGEPFSHPQALRYGLAAGQRAGRYTAICTSGFWAQSVDVAGRVLDSYPSANCLWLSTDVYHEEWVPLVNLRHATEAGLARGLDVFYQITDGDTQSPGFLNRLEEALGSERIGPDYVFAAPLGSEGRAGKELIHLFPHKVGSLEQVPDIVCPYLGTPWLHEDGVVCACPNLGVHKTPMHPLQIGDLNRDDFREVATAAQEDLYLQALRVFGPRRLAEMLPVEEWGWNRAQFQGTTICDLCHSLAAVPDLPQHIREAMAAGDLPGRIDTLRLLLYSEVPPRLAAATKTDPASQPKEQP